MSCSHKEYSSFLGGKLTMFKLCNYAGKGKSCDFLDYFIVYEAYFVAGEF
jgi:hypothetical protein